MKRLRTLLPLFFLATLIVCNSCKKNSGSPAPPETVLSKILRNGALEQEFQYNAQKQLSRYIYYPTSRNSDLEYNSNGTLKSITETGMSGQLFSKKEYHYNPSGVLDTIFVYLAPEVVVPGVDLQHTSSLVYEYNGEGQITKETRVDPKKGDPLSYNLYTYNNNGSIKKIEYWKINAVADLTKVWLYGKSDSIPALASKIKLSPIDINLAYFYTIQIHTTSYNAAGIVSNEYEEKLKDRVFDKNGYMTEQTIERNFILPASPGEEVELVYIYISI